MTKNTNVVSVSTMSKGLSDLLTNNMNIGMDELVAVFIAKYETDLFDKKDVISKHIKDLKAERKTHEKIVAGKLNTDCYVGSIAVVGLTCSAVDTDVYWSKESHLSVKVEFKFAEKANNNSSNSFMRMFSHPISDVDVDTHNRIDDDIDSASAELTELLMDIKSVSRKERQVRGRISELKLEQTGFKELLDSSDMLALIEVK